MTEKNQNDNLIDNNLHEGRFHNSSGNLFYYPPPLFPLPSSPCVVREDVGGARCSVSETEGKSDGPRLVARLARLVRRQGASGPDLSVSVLLWVGAAPTLGICHPAFDLFRRILAGETGL